MVRPKTDKNWVVYLSTFPPRECGIATFSQDLSSALDQLFAPGIESKIVAMNIDEVSPFNYPAKVIYKINQSNPGDYIRVARELNSLEQVKLVNIQHEFGIFGGRWGEYVLNFMENLDKPIIVTFHSVLPNPEIKAKQVVSRIAARSFQVVVMTRDSREILLSHYGINKKKIKIIPHGIHPMPFTNTERAKNSLAFSGKTVLSTFGLLSKNKGIEYIIEALPTIVKKFPNILYLVVGATHPVVLKKDGERYRNFLVKKVYDLGLSKYVKFYNRYLSLHELLEFLKATDVYLASSLNPDQAVSGTFSYALGAGRPVVSTAFAQAKEDISSGSGILVGFKNPAAYRDAIIKLIENPALMQRMSERAYSSTRNMTWPNVAILYMKIFSKVIPMFAHREKNLPRLKFSHVQKLTDNFGIFQFAKLAEPDISLGYTVDDNSRALISACLYYEKFRLPQVLRLINIYLNFIQFVAKDDGYYLNYVNYDKSFNDEANGRENLEDASARALYALAVTAASKSIPLTIRKRASGLYLYSLGKNINFIHPRAIAFFVKGLCQWLGAETRQGSDKKISDILDENCSKLVRAFRKNTKNEWKWFEKELTYANGLLPDALLSAYSLRRRRNTEWFEVGKSALDFLISKTFIDNIYTPIGQGGWYSEGGERAYYDQQPEDPSAMVQALKTMYLLTKDDKYRKLMLQSFYWFLGDNTLGRIMYDASTGGCYDGLKKRDINLNQGAESTLSYLIARLIL